MNVEALFLINLHPDRFRYGFPAEIVGVVMVTPDGHEVRGIGQVNPVESPKPRMCYKVEYPDGFFNYEAIENPETTYIIMTYEAYMTYCDLVSNPHKYSRSELDTRMMLDHIRLRMEEVKG